MLKVQERRCALTMRLGRMGRFPGRRGVDLLRGGRRRLLFASLSSSTG
jgi:hypothetical protein